MKRFILLVSLVFMLFSCKQKQKFDYSLLEGHWLLDSVYSINDETMFIYNNIEEEKKTMRYYSFSKNMMYDTQVDSFYYGIYKELNKSFDETFSYPFFYYEIKNDTIKTFEIDRVKYLKEKEIFIKETKLEYKVEFLNNDNLILDQKWAKLFYSKAAFNSHILTKQEELNKWEKLNNDFIKRNKK